MLLMGRIKDMAWILMKEYKCRAETLSKLHYVAKNLALACARQKVTCRPDGSSRRARCLP
jgi:hypothetical protein